MAKPKNDDTVKMISILSYIGFLWILGFFIEKENKYVKFHMNQGIILFFIEIVLGFLSSIFMVVPLLGKIFASAVGLICLIYMLLGILNAAQGKKEELPIIGNLFTFID